MLKADGLARLLRSGLSRAATQAQDDIDLDIEVLTTSSALAYKYYSEGWRYHRTGDYEQSLIMLGKAVELDPEFAMAYRMMSVDARNLRYIDREAEYMRKAFELDGAAAGGLPGAAPHPGGLLRRLGGDLGAGHRGVQKGPRKPPLRPRRQ